MTELWIIVVAIICNVACALLGCYLVLRRISLMGDAISHAVLPGIALAFLLTGQITSVFILFGAMALGVATAFLTESLQAVGNVPEDASLGVVFTSLFAIGVILISKVVPAGADLDADCVFFGNIIGIPAKTFVWLGLELPEALPTMLLALVSTLAFVFLLWKELQIATFDPGLAAALGLKPRLMHYLLMAMVAGVTVTSFEAVGAILVIAMLVVPAATAHLLTDRLPVMLGWAAAVAIASAVLGTLLCPANAEPAGMMAVMTGALFLLALLLAPRHGVIARILRSTRLALRIAAEDLLSNLYRQEERAGHPETVTVQPVVGFTGWLARWRLRQQGQVAEAPVGLLTLTEKGRRRAQSLVRAHRLWEAYLDKNFELPPDHLHDPATRMEHFLDPTLQQQLAAELDQPQIDPHGRTIPPGK
jgi:ABC-type Mn2+/Zn2+ transport system permease subunit/Mn-dependent DtxR family transcriptional regulator